MSQRKTIIWTVGIVLSIPGALVAAYCLAYCVWLTAYYTEEPQLSHAQRSAYFWFALMLLCLMTPMVAVFRWALGKIKRRKVGF